ncbi:MAG: hypothetical protein QNI98_00405 [Woeseiaceae bacterium]|nr:hypothetical protein [Woeseiaceae bacterium]
MNYGTEFRTKRYRRVLSAVALAILAPVATLADDQSAMPFQMGVVEDQAYGRSIQSGKYELAIGKLTRPGRFSRGAFPSQNNLCVAYVKTSNLEKAAAACNAAVNESKAREKRATKKSPRSTESRAYRSDLAVALSNRGVLRAVSGDASNARADFHAALELDTRYATFATNNLQRLDSDAGTEN